MARKRPSNAPQTGQVRNIRLSDLYLDSRNPRILEPEQALSQRKLLEILWREFAVDEVALSIAANGYFEHEPLFATTVNGRTIVVEGNRRLAAAKLLVDSELRNALGAGDLPRISPTRKRELETLPVVLCQRESIWHYVGFKHVNGPQQWNSDSKAQYIAWVHNELHVPLDRIAYQIGDQHATVKRLYRGLMVLQQAENQAGFDREDRFKKHFAFSHLYTGLDYPGIQRFLGLQRRPRFGPDPVPRQKLNNLSDLCVWLYGSKVSSRQPLIRTQNPDLRILDEVLMSSDGTAALRKGLPLQIAHDISRGDERLLREALVVAKQSLQEARGKLLTGYSGELDLLATAEEIVKLAEDIFEEMGTMRTMRAARKKSKKKTKR